MVFRDNAEHPPLGRWLLGIASVVGQPVEMFCKGGADPVGLYIWSARMAPAAAFAATVGLVVLVTARRYGTAAGVGSGFSLAVMPRVFAHAHIAALDTFISLFWVLALFAADHALTARRPVASMAVAGAIWSLALLTKIHAWFLIPVVLVWSFIRLRNPQRALGAFAAWGAAGMACFVAGWPWLWFDTVSRLRAYLGTGVERASIRVLYLGRVYADHDVPWHYPWFYFAVTVPIGLHLLGFMGLWRGSRLGRHDRLPWLLAGSILLFLTLFSTRVPVYDGERLFLVVFPLWAVLIGLGLSTTWENLKGRVWARACLVAVVIAQGQGVWSLHPFGLSYFNALVGGLPGAETRGLELTYWGDAVDDALLDRLAAEARTGVRASLVPTLYPGQGVMTTSRAMARRGVSLGDEEGLPASEWVVLSRRSAYWPPGLAQKLAAGRVVLQRSRQGVWLSALIEFPGTPRPASPASHLSPDIP